MAQEVSRQPLTDPGSDHVGFEVEKVVLRQVLSPEYYGFFLSVSFHWCSITQKNRKNT
jgi:hypothetical protein